MPTTRSRHAITETAAVARALEVARQKWPEDRERPSRLLLHLVEEGERAIRHDRERLRQRRLAAIERIAGTYTDMYPKGYLEELRAEWPE